MKAKMMVGWVVGSIAVLALLIPRVFAADTKIAYVDVGKVFDDYEKTKQFDQELQAEGKKKQEERDKLVYEVRRLRDEQALLAEDKKADLQGKIDSRLRELDQFDQEAQNELGEKRNTIMKEVFSDIDEVVKTFGQRKGYDLVLNERALLYKNPAMDQTDNVLKELNSEYKKKKK